MINERLYLENQKLTFRAYSKKFQKMVEVNGSFSGLLQIQEFQDYPPDYSDSIILKKLPETSIILECNTSEIEIKEPE